MTMFWVGLIGGLWIGAPVGFVFAAILANNRDKQRGIDEA
jgi:hypothetical protein